MQRQAGFPPRTLPGWFADTAQGMPRRASACWRWICRLPRSWRLIVRQALAPRADGFPWRSRWCSARSDLPLCRGARRSPAPTGRGERWSAPRPAPWAFPAAPGPPPRWPPHRPGPSPSRRCPAPRDAPFPPPESPDSRARFPRIRCGAACPQRGRSGRARRTRRHAGCRGFEDPRHGCGSALAVPGPPPANSPAARPGREASPPPGGYG